MAGDASRFNGKKGGRPRGKKTPRTLEKEAVLKAFRDRVMKTADILFNSQLSLAQGQTYLYKIEKEKVVGPRGGISYRKMKPVLVTEKWEIEAYLEGEIVDGDIDDENDHNATYYYITTKDPDNGAIDSMLDRAFGKSTNVIATTDEKGKQMAIATINVIPLDGKS